MSTPEGSPRNNIPSGDSTPRRSSLREMLGRPLSAIGELQDLVTELRRLNNILEPLLSSGYPDRLEETLSDLTEVIASLVGKKIVKRWNTENNP